MRLKVKLFLWFVIARLSLCMVEGVAVQRASLDDCDFDFREQPEDFAAVSEEYKNYGAGD